MTTIRHAQHNDFAAIARVEVSAGELFADTHMAWAVGETTDADDLGDTAAAGLLWVAEGQDEIVGFLLAEIFPADLHIWEVAVHRGWQNQGIGRALVETALIAGAVQGCNRATLTTDRTLPRNAPYYDRLGFIEFAESDRPARLSAQLASEPMSHLRCAMGRVLV